MDKHTEKEVLRTAIVEAVNARVESADLVGGVAFYDLDRDALLLELSSVNSAITVLSQNEMVAAHFGASEAARIVLEFMYRYFEQVSRVAFDEAAFESAWKALAAEIDEPYWTYRGVANLRYVTSELPVADLGFGVTILQRSFDALRKKGFGESELQMLRQDWGGLGASSFVVLVERRLKKEPGNLVMVDTSPHNLAQRAISALRLLKAGDISMGPMWIVRHAHFGFGGGMASVGASIPTMGSKFELTSDVLAATPRVCAELQHLEADGGERAPGNLGLALRSFMGTYDRWPPGPDSRLLDSITALEAVLGADSEITFKLAFRVANLLGRDDVERSAMLDSLKGFYDTRSKLVHGAVLKEKHQQQLGRVDELREYVRRVLRVFVHLAATGHDKYTRQFFRERLDATLMNTLEREALRQALGLDV